MPQEAVSEEEGYPIAVHLSVNEARKLIVFLLGNTSHRDQENYGRAVAGQILESNTNYSNQMRRVDYNLGYDTFAGGLATLIVQQLDKIAPVTAPENSEEEMVDMPIEGN